MGLLDWTEKNPALTQGLLAAAFGAMAGRGTRLQALGQGGITGLLGYSNAQGRMADAEKEKEAAKMRQMQMGMLESQMTQQQAQAAQRAKDQEAFRSAFNPTSGPQAMAGGGGPTMANAEKIGQVPKFDPRSMLGMGASPEAVMQAAQFNDALTPKRKLRDVSPGAVVIDETSGQEVFRAPEKQDLNSLIVMGPDGKPMLNQLAFDAKQRLAQAGASSITNYGSPQQGVDANGNPVFFRVPDKGSGAPVIVPGVSPPKATTEGKPPTEFQAKAALYFKSMQTASQTLDKLEAANAWRPSMAERAAPGNTAKTLVMGESRQKYTQAQRQWIDSINRVRSGANLPELEYERAVETFFPVFGEGENIRAQKAAARRQEEQAMAAAAGNALPGGGKAPQDNDDPLGLR